MLFRLGLIFFLSLIPAGLSWSQDIERISPPSGQAGVHPAPTGSQIFRQEELSIDVPNQKIVHKTTEFPFKSFRDEASAVATGCQVFKEKDENLWWANCGRPITDVAVVVNVSED